MATALAEIGSSSATYPSSPETEPSPEEGQLVAFLRREFSEMDRHRTKCGLTQRIRTCLRLRDGQYDPEQLAEIGRMGGSQVFVNLTRNKCRGAVSMLREIFLGRDRPWNIEPTPVPKLPEEIFGDITAMVEGEVDQITQMGQPIDARAIQNRMEELARLAEEATLKKARDQAERATRRIDDHLVEGGFYEALDAFLYDYVTYPYAVLVGPTAIMRTEVRYSEGVPERVRRPVLTWRRADPADVWWTPGVARVEEAAMFERMRLARADINALIGLPGYDEDAIRAILQEYGDQGYVESWLTEHVSARAQNRDELLNEGDTIDVLVWTGPLYGRRLAEFGYDIPDEDLDYLVQAWVCGRYVLKLQIDPDPRMRSPYYVTSYEQVPGSPAGYALPELFADLQQIANATVRAAVNNLSLASGPQIALNSEMTELGDEIGPLAIHPWKVWKFSNDPGNTPNGQPITFFQPEDRLQSLMLFYQFISGLADEVSAIPRYMTGNERIGGAGRTASGLSQLMGGANRVMKSVASNIDRNVLEPAIRKAYDLILLTSDEQTLTGDEQIRVRGATLAEMQDADRMRLLEFLQMTANPMDMEVLGLPGRATVLREIAKGLGMEGERIVPSDQEMQQRQQMAQMMAQQAQMAGGGGPPGGGGGPPAMGSGTPGPRQGRGRVNEAQDNRQRTRGVNTPGGPGR
jgi:hypothetical protein